MRRGQVYALVGITAVGAIVRFATLDAQSFDHDEAVTAMRVLHPSLFDTLSEVANGERSPPLYYILAWGWTPGSSGPARSGCGPSRRSSAP